MKVLGSIKTLGPVVILILFVGKTLCWASFMLLLDLYFCLVPPSLPPSYSAYYFISLQFPTLYTCCCSGWDLWVAVKYL